MSIRCKSLRYKVFFTLSSLVFLLLIASGYVIASSYYSLNEQLSNNSSTPYKKKSVEDSHDTSLSKYGQRLNLLLLGIDVYEENTGRTDTIILASIDTRNNKVDLLSIPRDTRVQIPEYGWDKINHAMVYGGPELTMDTVSDLLGIPLRYYIVTNFNGFEKIVDILGGVTIDVEQDMHGLKKGVQRLNGEKALKYVRYRGYPKADMDRIQHQLKFLRVLYKETLQTGTITKLPKLVPVVKECISTNFATDDLYMLASAAKTMNNNNFRMQILPGKAVMIKSISYWSVDRDISRHIGAKIINGEVEENHLYEEVK